MLRALTARLWARSRPPLAELVYTGGGVGDELLLTAVAQAARSAGRPVHILTDLPELWRDNPDPLSVQTGIERWHYAKRRGWIATSLRHLPYASGTGHSIGRQLGAALGVDLPPMWRPRLPAVRPSERDPRLIAVQNSCRGARYACTTKEWPQERWTELVQTLRVDHDVVQYGVSSDPLLEGVTDLRGRTTLLQAAEGIARARLFIGLESGLMHVAAAVGTPAVILHGGRTFPEETGYPFFCHLTRQPECAGCGLAEGCPHALRCMDIPVEDVLAAVRRELARPLGESSHAG